MTCTMESGLRETAASAEGAEGLGVEGLAPLQLDVRREGRGWTLAELKPRLTRLLDLWIEVSDGKLFRCERTRRAVLGMLLENVGMDEAVRLGALSRWKEAIEAAERERGVPEERGPHGP